jgi:diadenosine tetraphosphate (Ap4A) HIT family hydrolase
MDKCPFCDDKIRERMIQESDNARVFFSNPRLTKGHLLVTPKRHVEQPWQLTDQELKEIFTHIHQLQMRLSETLGTGCDIRQNYRPFIQQGRLKVDHLHFHLIPRTLKDELYEKSMIFETEIFKKLSNAEIKEVRAILGNA